MANDGNEFSAGDRILISDSYYWARNVSGTVKEPQSELNSWLEGWHGCRKEESSRRGKLIFYWVEFDQPQIDGDGDGPYFAGAIDSGFMVRIKESLN